MTKLEQIMDRLANEPIAVASAIDAIITLLVLFGLHISPETKTAIIGAVSAVLMLFARQQVTPTRKLEDHSGVRSPNTEGSA